MQAVHPHHPASLFSFLFLLEVWHIVSLWSSGVGRCTLGSGCILVILSKPLVRFTLVCSECHAVSHLAVPDCWEPVLLHAWDYVS